MSWVDEIEGWKVRVYTKDVDLPNEGREASTYLHAILKRYDSLGQSDLVACVQGSPFDHCPDLTERLTKGFTRFTPLGNWEVVCDWRGAPHHPGLPIAATYTRWLGRPAPQHFTFIAGAQFVVTGREVRRHSRAFYRTLLSEMGGDGPWIIERLWGSIFE